LTSLALELEICEDDHRSKNLVSFDGECNARKRELFAKAGAVQYVFWVGACKRKYSKGGLQLA
jgi:hypothetical protein